jgi:cell division protein FtsQ
MTIETLRRRVGSRSPRSRLALLVVGLVILIVAAVWALYFSSWLKVDDVNVTGLSVLSKDDVLAVAAVRTGVPLVRLDGDAVADRVAALKPVEDVSVSRSWPHTVVPTDDGFAILDHEGVAYQDVPAPPDGVPTLATDDADELAITGVLEMLAELPDALRARLVTIRAETADSIELDLTDGVTVVWGSAEQSARKADVLVALMKQPGSVYIVSAPDAPAIRE